MIALIFLIASASIAIAYGAVKLFGPGCYTPWERLLYAPAYVLARVLWRVELIWSEDGKDDSSASSSQRMLANRLASGALLVANHRCSIDPFFIQLISGKRVHWMVAGEYFKHALFGPILRSYQAIPTNRGGVDTASTKRAIALARSGHFVGMFPEGRINRTSAPLLTIRPGAGIVAQRAQVPLIPIWIEGAPCGWEVYSGLFMAAKVKIYIGAPIQPRNSSHASNSVQDSDHGTNTSTDAGAMAMEFAEHPEDNVDTGNAARTQGRQDAYEWVSEAMKQSLRLGGYGEEQVCIAGRQWVDS